MSKKKTKRHKVKQVARTYVERLCDDKKCEFYGKPQQQGVCHTTSGILIDWDALDCEEKEILAGLADMKKRSGMIGEYVRTLEAHYVSAMINWQGSLDETIRLRRDIALLRAKSKR